MKEDIIRASLSESRQALEDFLADEATVPTMSRIVDTMAESLRQGGKIMSCGNGGSLCDATHFAEELTGRFRGNRRPLPAMAINDPAYLTCTGNDFEYADIFSRWVEAFGQKGDVLLAITTSGNSENVIRACQTAKSLGMKVIGLTAKGVSRLADLADICLTAPRTPHSDRIQEIHIKVIHIVIEAIEKELGL